MARSNRIKFQVKKGLPPGALVYVGEKSVDKTLITLIDYNENDYEETTIEKIEDIFKHLNKDSVTWVNIVGIQDVQLMNKICNKLGLHTLIIEDILNTDHHPKLEILDNQLLLILKMFHLNDTDEKVPEIDTEHISILLGKNYIITFQENENDHFDGIRNSLRNYIGQIRKRPADYLMYRLMDTIVDQYLHIEEVVINHLELLEEEIVYSPTQRLLSIIYMHKRKLTQLRTAILPVKEMANKLKNEDFTLVSTTTRTYLQDLNDHMVRAGEMIETIRNIVSSLLDVYYSSVSYKMNEVMKVLTIVSTIFIPLTFVAGIYGMNFIYMPELTWKWGYPLVIFFMLIISLIMIIYFKNKKWF